MTKPTEPDDPKQSSDSASGGGGERPRGKVGFRPSPTPRRASAPLVRESGDSEPKADSTGAEDTGSEPATKAASGSNAEPDAGVGSVTGGAAEARGEGLPERPGAAATEAGSPADPKPESAPTEPVSGSTAADQAGADQAEAEQADAEQAAPAKVAADRAATEQPAPAAVAADQAGTDQAGAGQRDPAERESETARPGESATRTAAAEPAEPAPANGHTTTPALPPPWQRVPSAQAGGGEATASRAAVSASSGTAARTRPSTGSGGPGIQGTEPRPVADVRAAEPTPSARPQPAQPAQRAPEQPADERPREARTVADEARAAGFDQPTAKLRSPYQQTEPERPRPAPGGFPMSWPRGRQPRQANLQLKRLDPWSVLKIALVLAVVLYLIWMVAVGVLYGVLDGIGVWDRLNGQYTDLVAEQGGDRLITAGRVFGVAAVVGAVNSLLVAVSLSVGAFIYNVSSDLVGGLELTLSERD